MVINKQTKYSKENPEVWVPSSLEDAEEEIPVLIKLFKKYGKVKSILDVGCGMGHHVYLLSKKGYICEGVEPHPKMVEYAKRNYPEVIYKKGSMQNIKYKNKFDAVMCVFSSIVFNKTNEEVVKTFSNFYRALKKGGILIIETYNSISWLANNSFRNKFSSIDRENNERVEVKEWIDTNNQGYVSERTYYNLKNGKKKGFFRKDSRMFFPLELRYFLERMGFKVKVMLSANDFSKIGFGDTKLDKRRLLVVAGK